MFSSFVKLKEDLEDLVKISWGFPSIPPLAKAVAFSKALAMEGRRADLAWRSDLKKLAAGEEKLCGFFSMFVETS